MFGFVVRNAATAQRRAIRVSAIEHMVYRVPTIQRSIATLKSVQPIRANPNAALNITASSIRVSVGGGGVTSSSKTVAAASALPQQLTRLYHASAQLHARKLGGSLGGSDEAEAAAIAEREASRAQTLAAANDPAAAAADDAANENDETADVDEAEAAAEAEAEADAEEEVDPEAAAEAAEEQAEADAVDRLEQSMAERIAAANLAFDSTALYSTGLVSTINKGFAIVDGLSTATLGSLLHITPKGQAGGTKTLGLVTSVEHSQCAVALLSDSHKVAPGDVVAHRSEQIPTFPYGLGVIGRVLNPLGEPLDGLGPVVNVTLEPSVDRKVPNITSRARIQSMIESGLKHFDVFHPLAKGMRMGLWGARKSGKSSIATRIICNQASINKHLPPDQKTYCVYVLTGQSKPHNEKVIRALRQSGAMEYTTVVVAENSQPAAMQYLAPYAGCTAAEYFRDNGMHAFIVYDDLSTHGAAYNNMQKSSGAKLLATSFIQAKILERASYMAPHKGSGSMTALCIWERQGDVIDALSNMEGFVDQLVYTDANLTVNGYWPPINCSTVIGRPPTRYQPNFTRPVTRLTTELISYSLETARNYEWASKFKLQVEDGENEVVDFKEKLQVLLNQELAMPLPLQFISLYAAGKNMLADVDLTLVSEWEKQLHLFMYNYNRPILAGFEALKFTDSVPPELLSLLDDAILRYRSHFSELVAERKRQIAKAAAAQVASASPNKRLS